MSSPSPATRLLAAAIVIVLLVAPAAAITCSDVIKDPKPCIDYLLRGSGAPPSPCCAGVSSLASAATTTADKQTAYYSLKNAAQSIKAPPQFAKSLPGNCGISLRFEVSPNVDCSKQDQLN